jgi:WD40 repeat protein
VINEYGNGPLDSSSVVTGRLKISDHRGPITDASFSPDGTAIATASIDGQVKFFQVKKLRFYLVLFCQNRKQFVKGRKIPSRMSEKISRSGSDPLV